MNCDRPKNPAGLGPLYSIEEAYINSSNEWMNEFRLLWPLVVSGFPAARGRKFGLRFLLHLHP